MFPDIIQSFRRLAKDAPEELLFTFLTNGDTESVVHTRRSLDEAASSIAAALVARGLAGERILVALPPGLEYVAVHSADEVRSARNTAR